LSMLPVLYVVLFLLPLDCLYFILHLFFGHWIACTLFCDQTKKYKQSND
jgi:hypothetical protein